MSTGITTFTGAYTIVCDKCGERDGMEFDSPRNSIATAWHKHLARQGWTFWVSRSLRTYCPSCAPAKGHKMREIKKI